MQFSLTLAAGPLSSIKSRDLDVADIEARIAWFLDGWAAPMPDGLTQTQRRQWLLDQAAQKLKDYFVAEAQGNRARILRAAATDLEQQAATETAWED